MKQYRLYISNSTTFLRNSSSLDSLRNYVEACKNQPDSEYIYDTEIWEVRNKKKGFKFSIEFTKIAMGWKKQKNEDRTILFLGYFILEWHNTYSLMKYKKI